MIMNAAPTVIVRRALQCAPYEFHTNPKRDNGITLLPAPPALSGTDSRPSTS